MPIIYGKTILSTAEDLFKGLSRFITYKEAFFISKLCFEYWKAKYTGVDSLIQLIRHTSWIASVGDAPVYYNVEYYLTIQDYMIFEPIKLSVYDRLHKKRRQITLRVPTEQRNRMKTLTATFANFIHQKDAYIAMRLVNTISNNDNIPIYTVHDNFITNSSYCLSIQASYIEAFCSLGSPLSIISTFIYINLFIAKDINQGQSLLKVIRSSGFLIPPEAFDSYIKDSIPIGISKKHHQSYEERLRGLRDSYYQYVRAISKDSESVEEYLKYHQIRWDNFRMRILKFHNNGQKIHYCVHL